MNSQILERVVASGICGIKKAELKKIFGKECEDTLEELAKDEKVIVDNKGVAHYVWSKENYVSHISEHDPKFKIISRLVTDLENSVNQIRSDLEARPAGPKDHKSSFDFQSEFDNALNEMSSSIGWVQFAGIRQRMCDRLQITQEKFYSMASQLIESNDGKYEISTGGQEGIQVRGMMHGYVRRL